jgi:hypothetical protein
VRRENKRKWAEEEAKEEALKDKMRRVNERLEDPNTDIHSKDWDLLFGIHSVFKEDREGDPSLRV